MRLRDLFGGRPIESTRHASISVDRSPRARDWTITVSVSSFGNVKFAWEATSETHARESFLEYLFNPEFDLPAWPGWRSHPVIFFGKSQSLVFKSEWVAAFTISH